MVKNQLGYKYMQVPTNLFLCCDLNCRSVLVSLIQLSTHYAAEDGWFFRTNSDLQAETRLSKNVLNGALDALYQKGIINIIPQIKGAREARKYRVNFSKFQDYDSLSMDDCCKHPDLYIATGDYRHGAPSFQRNRQQPSQQDLQQECGKCDNNKENIENKENKNSNVLIPEVFNTTTNVTSTSSFSSSPYSIGSTQDRSTSTQVEGGPKEEELNPTSGSIDKPGTQSYTEDETNALVDNVMVLLYYDDYHLPFDNISRKALERATTLYQRVFDRDFNDSKELVQEIRNQHRENVARGNEKRIDASQVRLLPRGDESQPLY